MKKLITITLLGLTLIACQNNKSNDNHDAKVQVSEEKTEQLSVRSESEVEVKEVKLQNDANEQIDNLKSKYKYLRAKFVSTDSGDLFYYDFVDEKGKEYSFSYMKDTSYELLIEDETADFGKSINPKYKDKYFDIFYQLEKHDLLDWGEKQEYDVIIKMILVE